MRRLLFLLIIACAGGTIAQQAATPGDSTALQVLKSATPIYPNVAEQHMRQGEVILRVKIGEDGSILEATPVSGDPIFHDAAIAAMKKYKFAPFIRNGKPVIVIDEIPIDFIITSQVVKTPTPPPPTPEAASDRPATTPDGKPLPARVRISRGISEGLLIRKVIPVYPHDAKRYGIQGSVLLQATIRKDGLVGELTAVSGPKELIPPSLDAVSLWRYRPYLLQGHPVEVQTTIQVNYILNQR